MKLLKNFIFHQGLCTIQISEVKQGKQKTDKKRVGLNSKTGSVTFLPSWITAQIFGAESVLHCIVLYCTVLYWETKNIPVFDFYLIKHVFLSVGSLLVLRITACASPYTTQCNTMFDDTLNQFLSFILCVLYYCLSARFIVLTFLNGYEDRSEHFFPNM